MVDDIDAVLDDGVVGHAGDSLGGKEVLADEGGAEVGVFGGKEGVIEVVVCVDGGVVC